MSGKRFRVALSFPGEHRGYVSRVADVLATELGTEAVFYYPWYQAELARANMDVYLQGIYHEHSELLVPFLCAAYERKDWCGLEWRAIRELLKQRRDGDIMPMRFDDTEIPGLFGIDGYISLTEFTPEQAAALILQRLKLNQGDQPAGGAPQSDNTPRIHVDRLPTVAGEFFGRAEELKLLDDALAGIGIGTDHATRVIQFIAAGGTGKTKLLRHWLNQHADDLPNLIVWSFYSQGSAEDKQVSASPFFTEAFNAFGADPTRFKTEDERADALAQRLMDSKTLLVLDGLEPLQHVGRGMDGRLKDRATARLLQKLAARHSSLCVITTRIRVHDLSDRPHVRDWSLDNLQIPDGVALLRSLGVGGPGRELAMAVREYDGHALALHLLGNALTTYLDGDIHKRDTLEELVGEEAYSEVEQHAFKVMQAYRQWLEGTPELRLLYLLGLFDQPIETEVLEALWQARIPGLTADLPHKAWLNAIRNLREKHRLLSTHECRPGLLDFHPLFRKYFGRQLRAQQPEAWRHAHMRLYEYYKALPGKELPDTLDEMGPLFNAVAHGCAAGLHQQTFDDIFWTRIKRQNDHFLTTKLGAHGDELALLAHFFTSTWSSPVLELREVNQASVLNWAGNRLAATGRYGEALDALRTDIGIVVRLGRWQSAAKATLQISFIQLSMGNIAEAEMMGWQALAYTYHPDGAFDNVTCCAALGDVMHQGGDITTAERCFHAAERLQRRIQPEHQYMYSYRGFLFCDLLITQGELAEAQKRADYALKTAYRNGWLMSIAQDQLTLGRVYLQMGSSSQATYWLEQAVISARREGSIPLMPDSTITRASLCRQIGDYTRAHQDLQEVYDLAEPSGMRLHLTDYHLEMARLALAEGQPDVAREHTEHAAQLIEATGYERRLPELEALRAALE